MSIARRANFARRWFEQGLRLHAERLVEVPGVRLYRFGLGGHELALQLRDAGALETMLRRALHAPLA